MVKILKTYLRTFISESQFDWYFYLPLTEFAYNNSIHSSTNMSPFFANYGMHPKVNFPPYQVTPSPISSPNHLKIIQRFSFIWNSLNQSLSKHQISQKFYYDQNHIPFLPLPPGGLVLINSDEFPRRNPSITTKLYKEQRLAQASTLQSRFIGPFRVIAKLSENEMCMSNIGNIANCDNKATM